MVKLEVNGITVNVPQSWDDVLLGDYETYFMDKPKTGRERVAFVAKIVKIDADTLLDWPAEIFNMIVDTLAFLFQDARMEPNPELMLGGVKYRVPIEDELTLGAWIDAEEAQKGATPLSSVLATVCRPYGEAYDYKLADQRQAMFAALPVSKVLGVLGFFLHFNEQLNGRTKAFTNLREAFALLPRNIKLSQIVGGGTRPLRIWRVIQYYGLIILLRYRLAKLSRIYNTKKIG